MSGELRHGKRDTYVRHLCRCDECRAANTAYWRAYRQTDAGREAHRRAKRAYEARRKERAAT